MENRNLYSLLCPEKKDVDEWLYEFLSTSNAKKVFFDAPLSLPRIYFDEEDEKSTHHYRQADIELKAMSPMFLGGLSARAIALKKRCGKKGMIFYETYPKAVLLQRFSGMTKDQALLSIEKELGYLIEQKDLSEHQKDSLLAWYAGKKNLDGESFIYGREIEGQIFV